MKNKKRLLGIIPPLLCLLLCSSSLTAQEDSAKVIKFGYGIKAGTTLSRFSSEQPHNNFKPGFTAGVFVNYRLSNSFLLQVEPAYMQQGGNLISITDFPMLLVPDPPFLLEVKDQKITFHNIDVPLLLKYEKTIAGLKLFAVAGPSFSYNLKAQSKNNVSARTWDYIPVYYDYYEEENISSSIETMQYGVVGGLGFETPVGDHQLTFDVRYRYGLNKTYPGYSYLGIYHIQGDLKSNTLYFTLGFGF